MEMKDAGAHKLRYVDYMGREYVEMVTHVTLPFDNVNWRDITKNQIPVDKVAVVICPKCKSNDWSNDSHHLKGYTCGGCGTEILAD